MLGMPPGAWLLYRLRTKARLRAMVRSLSTVRGMLLSGVGFASLFIWIVPSVVPFLFVDSEETSSVFKELAGWVSPEVAQLAMCLFMALTCVLVFVVNPKGAILYSLPEIDYLFPAPYTRRGLLAYKVGEGVLVIVPLSLVGALLLFWAPWPFVSCFVGLTLLLLTQHLFSFVMAVAAHSAGARLTTGVRKVLAALLAITILGGIAWAVWSSLPALPALEDLDHGTLSAYLAELLKSPPLKVVLAPFLPFAKTVVAPRVFPDLLLWGGIAVAMDAGLFWLLFRLDADFREVSANQSRATYERLRDYQRTGDIASLRAPKPIKVKSSLPDLPRLGGAGPLIWRQLVCAVRKGLWLPALAGCALSAFLAAMLVVGPDDELLGQPTVITFGLVCAVLVHQLVRFDFRSDFDNMEALKALPLSPRVVALGQVGASILLMCTAQVVFVASVGAAFGMWKAALAVVLFSLPLSLLAVSLENLVALLFPMRTAMANPADFQMMGRMHIVVVLKMFVALVLGGSMLAAGALVYMATHSQLLAGGVVWLVTTSEAALLLPLVAWAFKRYDPSRDTPD